ncbi:MAG: type II toxin-antitoxin system mRNA interferase toxin, RelE/StbE family [Parvibaculum sp.]|jgi:mRNA interferase RelE/StbE|uniref:type II toxin-antitoxin system RelE family toxin n=1 Tax=Parvibaculum sp. TaxID=2024848 RepID=UPI000C43F465|nr:type II toxin-antitoxin system RelE/ParE family toxin [Parvibaculum sp.]MAU61383.1 type II toxin-antitoxin system mRNA interferase toxin, RelE/StbE family [Parvibaculum sp.]|tara:strand:- start:1540 stop:1842 length:303 start_codon:yes stop_codon:yes gene_type:complete
MTYRLGFVEDAKKEWRKLAPDIKQQFRKILERRIETPRVEKHRLAGMPDCYKIKLRTVGYRLAYKVVDETVEVRVIGIGRRDGEIYSNATERQGKPSVPK